MSKNPGSSRAAALARRALDNVLIPFEWSNVVVQLILILLGVRYLRQRWAVLAAVGGASMVMGAVVIIDAMDGKDDIPIELFAWILLVEGVCTLAVAWTGRGGQKALRYLNAFAFIVAALLILIDRRNGGIVLAVVFGTLFLLDGLLLASSAWVVRYPRWRSALAVGFLEIGIAIFFYQPYPTHYVGTMPFALGLALFFTGLNMLRIATRVRWMPQDPWLKVDDLGDARGLPGADLAFVPIVKHAEAEAGTEEEELAPRFVWDGPPEPDEPALTVHVWTPRGSARSSAPQRYPVVDRYIAAVDANGVISTGHAALQSPGGVYVSLYPRDELDRSPGQFSRLLRATADNNVAGVFQPSYEEESVAWCPSTVQVRIRTFDEDKLKKVWEVYRRDTTYNLTYRNCSTSVVRMLDAAVEGSVGYPFGRDRGWRAFLRLASTPELWVAAQLRKRGDTMAWTPGLVLDYARAVSMLVDPRPYGWVVMARVAVRKMMRSRRTWRKQDQAANEAATGAATGA